MIKLLPTGIIVSAMLLIRCTKETETGKDITYACKNLPYIADTTKRFTSKSLKGYFLFSWKNNDNGWNYSIAPNLNIASAFDNVGPGNTFTGEECLKKNLSYFAEDEEFWWCGEGDLEMTNGKKITLSYPPDDIIEEIKEFGSQIKIELIIDN